MTGPLHSLVQTAHSTAAVRLALRMEERKARAIRGTPLAWWCSVGSSSVGSSSVWEAVGLDLRSIACKSWADRVPQCACGLLARKIFERDVGPYTVFMGSLLHDCYMARLLLTTSV